MANILSRKQGLRKHRPFRSFRLCAFLALPFALFGQSSPPAVTAPILGYALDTASQQIRPVLGIPGASILGPPLEAMTGIRLAAISPAQNYALISAAGKTALALLRFESGAASSIDGALGAPDRIVMSPSGQSAAVYSQSAQRLQILGNLPDHPSLSEISLPDSSASGDGAAGFEVLAISDDGQWVLGSAGVSLFALGRNFSRELPAGPVSAAAFRAYTHDAAVAGAGRITIIHDAAGQPDYQVAGLYSNDSRVVAVVFGARVLAAAADGNFMNWDLATGAVDAVSCGCKPTGLHPMSGNSVFRVNEISANPLLLLDTGQAARLWFVPPDREAGDSQ